MTDETTTPDAGVPIVLAIPRQRIADLITTALESPVGDWFRKATVLVEGISRETITSEDPWYYQAAYWVQPAAGLVCVVDKPTDDHPGRKIVRMEDFQTALILMATKDDGAYCAHFADFLRNNDDAITADLFMQFAIFGEEVFA